MVSENPPISKESAGQNKPKNRANYLALNTLSIIPYSRASDEVIQ